jgi:hypothetical protein
MRLIPSSAAVLVLLLSACEKKNDSSASGSGSDGQAKPTRVDRRERDERERNARESKALEEITQALEAAEKEADPEARQKALAAVAWDAIDIDREIAQKAFAGLTPGGEDAKRLVAHFAMRMADTDPDGALEWARGLEQEEERNDAIGRIAGVIAESDPKLAVSLATTEVPEGLPRDRASVQIVQRWSQKEPKEAATWVTSSLPEGQSRKVALQVIASSWSERDASGFAAWASSQQSQLPELSAAVAASLRTMPEEARKTRLASFPNEDFRKQIEAELEKQSTSPVPPLPKEVPPEVLQGPNK